MACLRSLDQTSEQPDANGQEPVEPARFSAGSQPGAAGMASPLPSLRRLAEIISSGRDAHEIIRDFQTELAKLIENETFGVLIHDAERSGFTWYDDLGLKSFDLQFIPDGAGLTSAVFQAGTAELVNFATNDPRYWPPVTSENPIPTEHLMLAPISVENRPIGLMIVGRFGEIPFAREEFEIFLVVAELTGGALRSARTLESLAMERDTAVRSVQSLERLLEAHRAVAVADTYSDIVKVVASELRALVPCRKLAMIRFAGDQPSQVYWSEEAGSVVTVSDQSPFLEYPAVERAKLSCDVQVINDLDPSAPGFGGARSIVEPEHLLVVPIDVSGNILGAVVLTRIGNRRFEAIDAHVVRSFVLHAVVKSRNLSLLESTLESERREIRSRERVEAILSTARAIVSWHDLPQVIAAVGDLLQRQIGHDRFLAIAIGEDGMAASRHYRRAGRQVRVDHQIDIKMSALSGRLRPGALGMYEDRLITRLGIDDDGERSRRLYPGCTLVYTVESPDRLVGAVLLERSNGAPFSEEEQSTFEALSGLVAVAFQTASLFDEERRGRTNADLLAEVGGKLSEAVTLPELAGSIAEIVARVSGARSSWCAIVDDTHTGVLAHAAGGLLPPIWNEATTHSAKQIAGELASAAPVREQLLSRELIRSLVDIEALPVLNARDLSAVSIAHDGQIRGLVLIWNVESRNNGRRDSERPLASTIDLVRAALSRAFVNREAEQRILELNAISSLNQLAASTGATAEVFCEVGSSIALELTRASGAAIAIGSRPESRVIVRAGDSSGIDCGWIEPHWNAAQRSRAPFEIEAPVSENASATRHIALPIIADEGLLGLMVLTKNAGRFSKHDRDAAMRIAEQMAVGLQRISTLDLAINQRSRADRQTATLGRVLDATSLFVTIHDREELLRNAVGITADLVDCARIAILWRDRSGQIEGSSELRWPGALLPGAKWEQVFLEESVLTGVAQRRSHLDASAHFDFTGMDAEELGRSGIHLLVTPIGDESAGVGAIAYTRIGGEPFDDDEFAALRIYAAQLTAALASARLIGRNRELLVSGIRALVSAVDAKDPYTRGHSERVSLLARIIAIEMEIAPDEVDTIELAGLLHDFGKIGVPDAILHKPGKLTPAERVIMMRHAGLGADMLAGVESEAMAPLVPLVRHHHEWVNGGGYPDGLIGDQIPLGSAIISVADAYDTMTTDRPYRNRISHRQAMAELYRSMGRQFSAPVVEALESLAKSASIPRMHGPEIDAIGEVTRLPLAADRATPIEDARALKLLLDMIPITHLIADTDVFYQQVTELVRNSLALPQISLYLTDDAGSGLVRIASSGDSPEIGHRQQPLSAGIRGAALRSRRFRVVGDVQLDPAFDSNFDPDRGSMLLTPLIVDDTVIGLLSAESSEVRGLDPMNEALLQVVADQVASAVRLAQLHAEARLAAMTDPLTGLGNHRAFWTEIDVAIAAGDRFSVVMIDVEGLKRINDSLGHLAGDALLQRIATYLRSVTREHDLAARLGGDEFAVVLRKQAASSGMLLAERVRELLLQESDDRNGRATIRYGVASFPDDGERARDLVAVADSRLYAMMNQFAIQRSATAARSQA